MTKSKNTNQMSIWKENLLKKKAENDAKEEKFKKSMESGEMYNNMVSEAVGFITAKVTKDTQSSYTLQKVNDGKVEISIYNAFIITPDLHLYSGAIFIPTNPKTGKDYFFNPYGFKDEEQVKQFFRDVKAQLPDEVRFSEREAYPSDLVQKGSRIYDVLVEIDLNN